ncbi:MAG: transcriptional regulator [Alphaproteobacteria bacterium]|nr:MAG: transcriptional regulator [Alphaproteobacteria bacterium]
MAKKKYIRACSIWRALEHIGDHSTLLILEAAFLGVRRFDQFQRRTRILRTVLSDRLRKLIATGCFERVPYSNRPLRYEYRLTEKGRGLYGAALMMLRWEKKWARKSGKIEVKLRHRGCGNDMEPISACQACHGEIDPRAVSWQEGPGIGRILARYNVRRKQTAAAAERHDPTTLLDEISRIIGDRWSSLILRSCFTGLNTYEEIREDTQIATNILADRLKGLCDVGLLRKQRYEDHPPRYQYRLTDKGRDIYPILLMLLEWGDRWYAAPEGPPLLLFHDDCGNPLVPEIVCSACGEPLTLGAVDFQLIEPENDGQAAPAALASR